MVTQPIARDPVAPEEPRAASVLQPGERIGPFRLCEKLGQGATGVVFAARDERHGRAVALKIPRFPSNPMLMQRFLREGRVGMAVRHPNLVEVLEIAEVPGRSLMVMELVRGETLRAKLQAARGRGLPLETTLQIARRVCRGLAHAHAAGIVHRDIKPGNIMITSFEEVKLLDFGIAKVPRHAGPWWPSEGGCSAAPLTDVGAVLGTPGYMSPEQARGDAVDARTDVFSLGVVLYEMLTGMRPFQGSSALDVMFAAARDRPPPPWPPSSPHPHCLKLVVNHMVLRCLDKLPDRRFADAGRLLQELVALSRLARMAIGGEAPRAFA